MHTFWCLHSEDFKHTTPQHTLHSPSFPPFSCLDNIDILLLFLFVGDFVPSSFLQSKEKWQNDDTDQYKEEHQDDHPQTLGTRFATNFAYSIRRFAQPNTRTQEGRERTSKVRYQKSLLLNIKKKSSRQRSLKSEVHTLSWDGDAVTYLVCVFPTSWSKSAKSSICSSTSLPV